jgi:hypothetical protein
MRARRYSAGEFIAGNWMLLCDGCNAACHTLCCSPPLDRVPEGDWLCRHCAATDPVLPAVQRIPSAAPLLTTAHTDTSVDTALPGLSAAPSPVHSPSHGARGVWHIGCASPVPQVPAEWYAAGAGRGEGREEQPQALRHAPQPAQPPAAAPPPRGGGRVQMMSSGEDSSDSEEG